MTAEGNKDTILRYWTALNSRDAKAASAFWAQEPINNGKQREHEDIERLHESLVLIYDRVSVHELIAEDDWVACRITAEGRHNAKPPIPFDSGIYQLLEPQGRTFSFQHIHMFRLEDGKIKEHWANRDDLGAAKQLGLNLSPE